MGVRKMLNELKCVTYSKIVSNGFTHQKNNNKKIKNKKKK